MKKNKQKLKNVLRNCAKLDEFLEDEFQELNDFIVLKNKKERKAEYESDFDTI